MKNGKVSQNAAITGVQYNPMQVKEHVKTMLQFVGQNHQDLLRDYVVFDVRALTGS